MVELLYRIGASLLQYSTSLPLQVIVPDQNVAFVKAVYDFRPSSPVVFIGNGAELRDIFQVRSFETEQNRAYRVEVVSFRMLAVAPIISA